MNSLEYNQKQYLAMYLDNNIRQRQIKLDIYNKHTRVGLLIGLCVGGTLSISNQSAYRRTGTLDLVLDESLLPKHNGRIWFNKITKIHIGVSYKGEMIWYNLGEYAISDVNLSESKDGGNIQIELLDKMAFLDGTLGGESEYRLEIEAKKGMKVNDVIAATVKDIPEVSIERFEINGIDAVIPYDLEFQYGATVYEILKEITELYMYQEFFFDVDGVFRVQRVLNRQVDPVVWDFSEGVMNTIITPTNNIYFSNVRNLIRVWGGLDKNTGKHFTWKLRNCGEIDNLDGVTDKEVGDLYKVDKEVFVWNNEEWKKIDLNIVPEFSHQNIGLKNKVIEDEKIMTMEQAVTRSIYELHNYSHFAEKITLDSLPIYILDVNDKIHIESPRVNISGDYLITSINLGLALGDTMSINAEKIYY